MKNQNNKSSLRFTIGLSIAVAVLITLATTTPTLANLIPNTSYFSQWVLSIVVGGTQTEASVLAAPQPDLPPRPTGATAAAVQGAIVGSYEETKPRGGWIELQVQNVTDPGLWSIVQWQDSAGTWLDVDSWRGLFDRVESGVGVKKWWVDAKDFNTKFRWIVFKGNRNTVVFTSPAVSVKENKQLVILPVAIQIPY